MWLLLTWSPEEGLCLTSSVLQRRAHESPDVSSFHVCLSVHCIWDEGWGLKTWGRSIFSALYAMGAEPEAHTQLTVELGMGSPPDHLLCSESPPAPKTLAAPVTGMMLL